MLNAEELVDNDILEGDGSVCAKVKRNYELGPTFGAIQQTHEKYESAEKRYPGRKYQKKDAAQA